MTAPITAGQVESEILRLSGLLDHATTEIAKRARAAAEADSTYKREHAKAFLSADGAMDLRKAQADVSCTAQYEARRATEAVLLGAQEAARNLRAQLDALRSVMVNVRALT